MDAPTVISSATLRRGMRSEAQPQSGWDRMESRGKETSSRIKLEPLMPDCW